VWLAGEQEVCVEMISIPLRLVKLSADGRVAPASRADVANTNTPKPPAPPKPPEPPKPPNVTAPYAQPASPTSDIPNLVPTEDRPKEVLPPDEEWVWSPETEKDDGTKGAWIRMKKSSLPY